MTHPGDAWNGWARRVPLPHASDLSWKPASPPPSTGANGGIDPAHGCIGRFAHGELSSMKGKILLTSGLLALLALSGCSTSYDRRDPTGEVFPSVRGEALDGREVALPEVAGGRPLLLLIGYDQDAQFDIDRWLYGLADTGVDVMLFEVPTIPGMVPRLLSDTIDGGMRRGIPQEDWGLVVTVYRDAEQIARFTGNADGLTGRVVLLDADGRVVFFHDRGYSVGTLRALLDALRRLPG